MRLRSGGMMMFAGVCGIGAVAALSSAPDPGGKNVATTIGTHPGGVGQGLWLAHMTPKDGDELAAFSSGCFWGTEDRFRHLKGVVATAVGYMGGKTPAPNEAQAMKSGHAETVLVEYDPKRTSYDALLGAFWKMRYPTSPSGVDPLPHKPYRSAIWTFSPTQQRKAAASKTERQSHEPARILTRIQPAMPFYLAEDFHQQYDERMNFESCDVR